MRDPRTMTLEERREWWAALTPEQRVQVKARFTRAPAPATRQLPAPVAVINPQVIDADEVDDSQGFAKLSGVRRLNGAAADAARRRIRDRELADLAEAPDYPDWVFG